MAGVKFSSVLFLVLILAVMGSVVQSMLSPRPEAQPPEGTPAQVESAAAQSVDLTADSAG